MVKMSLLTAIALGIFVVEMRIPSIVSIPGVKLGLANIVTIFAVYNCSPRETILMLISRITLGAIFCGTPISFIYSFSGAIFCLMISMAAKHFIPRDKMWITSIFGAIFHNIGQIIAAMIVLESLAIVAYFPILAVSGAISGAFCGLCASFVTRRLEKHIE